jgi:hypothetical protein
MPIRVEQKILEATTHAASSQKEEASEKNRFLL